LDTYPPIFYLNDVSKAIINVLTHYNTSMGEIKVSGYGIAVPVVLQSTTLSSFVWLSLQAAYTLDAGPNCVIYARRQDVPAILSLVEQCFPSTNDRYLLVLCFVATPTVPDNNLYFPLPPPPFPKNIRIFRKHPHVFPTSAKK